MVERDYRVPVLISEKVPRSGNQQGNSHRNQANLSWKLDLVYLYTTKHNHP